MADTPDDLLERTTTARGFLRGMAHRVLITIVFAGALSPFWVYEKPAAIAGFVLSLALIPGAFIPVAMFANGWPTRFPALLRARWYVALLGFVVGAAHLVAWLWTRLAATS